MQQRLREDRIESLARSVGRSAHKGRLARLFGLNGKVRRGHADVDFHDRGEDVWRALRD